MDWEVVEVRPLLFANALSACLGGDYSVIARMQQYLIKMLNYH